MARMRESEPNWNICEELSKSKNHSRKKSKEELIKDGKEKGNGEPAIHPPRMKTLAQAARNEIPAVKAKIKSMLPILHQAEVRRYKIPHYESVILELHEANLTDAAEYIRKLIQLDENLREKVGPRTGIWQKPWLKDQNDLIDFLRDGLIIFNQAKQQGELMTEVAAFMEMAFEFQSKTSEWWWIAEELYQSALEVGSKIKIDDAQTLTILHFRYGKFLQNQMNESEKALSHLTEALRRAQNKYRNGSKILEINQNLHKVYLSLAKKLKKNDPIKAVEACIQALEKAQDSDCDEYVVDAFYELGKCQLYAGNTKEALNNFSKYLALVKRLENLEGICNAHKQLAFSYKKIKDEANTMKHFRLFKESAAEFQLPKQLADAHYYTGEHLLTCGQAVLATPHLEFSVSLYRNLNAINECDRARCVAGVSKGQEIMENYTKLIIDSGKKNSGAIEKLCKWKNNREPFWIDKKPHEESVEEGSLYEMENNDSKTSVDTFFSLSSDNESKTRNQEETQSQIDKTLSETDRIDE